MRVSSMVSIIDDSISWYILDADGILLASRIGDIIYNNINDMFHEDIESIISVLELDHFMVSGLLINDEDGINIICGNYDEFYSDPVDVLYDTSLRSLNYLHDIDGYFWDTRNNIVISCNTDLTLDGEARKVYIDGDSICILVEFTGIALLYRGAFGDYVTSKYKKLLNQ